MKRRDAVISLCLLLCMVLSGAVLAQAPQTAHSFTADKIAAEDAAAIQPPTEEEIDYLVNRLALCGSQLPAFSNPGQLNPNRVLYNLSYLATVENDKLLKQGRGVPESARAQYEREAAALDIWAAFFVRRCDLEWLGREIFGEGFALPQNLEATVLRALPGHQDVYCSTILEGPPFLLYNQLTAVEDRGGGVFAGKFHCFRVYFGSEGPAEAEGKRGGFYEHAGTFAPGATENLAAAFDRFQLSIPENTLDEMTVTFRRQNGRLIVTGVDDSPWPLEFLTSHVDLTAALGHDRYTVMMHQKGFRDGKAYYGVSVGSHMGDHITTEKFYYVAEDRSRIYQQNLTGQDFTVYEAG